MGGTGICVSIYLLTIRSRRRVLIVLCEVYVSFFGISPCQPFLEYFLRTLKKEKLLFFSECLLSKEGSSVSPNDHLAGEGSDSETGDPAHLLW